MAFAVANIRKIKTSDITFSDPIKNKKTNAVSVNMLYNGQKVQFRLPKISFPGGVLVRTQDSGQTTYTLIASLTGCDSYANERAMGDSDPEIVYNFMREVQGRVMQSAFENSTRWFGKKRSMESLQETFKHCVTASVSKDEEGAWVPNGKYPPSVRFKVPVWEGKVNMSVIDAESNPLDVTLDSLATLFPKSSSAKAVVVGSIYIAGLSFGITWKITDAQVFHQRRMTAADKFRDDEDDEEHVAHAPAPAPASVFADDTDDIEVQVEDTGHAESAPLMTPEVEKAAPPKTPAPTTSGIRRRAKA
jgi:hypothetical protein